MAAAPAPRLCPRTVIFGVFFMPAIAPTALRSAGGARTSHSAEICMPLCACAPAISGSLLSRGLGAQSPSVSTSFRIAVPRTTKKMSPVSTRWET